MAVPVTGSTSKVTWDADGSATGSSPVDVNKGSTYEYSGETKTEETGPFFGEPDITDVASGQKHGIKLELVVPEGNDAGQTALETGFTSKTRGTLVVYTVKGRKITLTDCLITKYTVKAEAKGTQTLSIEGVAPTAAFTAAPTS